MPGPPQAADSRTRTGPSSGDAPVGAGPARGRGVPVGAGVREKTPGTVARRAVLAVALVGPLAACSGLGPLPQLGVDGAAPGTRGTATGPRTRHPLTGLWLPTGERVRPVVAVKVDAVAAARPQYGLHEADLVVEEPVEGGLTRLMAVYSSRYPARVEPVRSARVTDAHVLQALGGGTLVYSGASRTQGRWLAGHTAMGYALLPFDETSAWGRDPQRDAPHDLQVDVRALGRRDEVAALAAPRAPLGVADELGVRGTRTRRMDLDWGATTVTWRWSAHDRRWVRGQDGHRHVGADGRPLQATTVVVLAARTVRDATYHDVNGVATPLPDLTAGGQAWVLRDGVRVAGRWSREGGTGAFSVVHARTGRPVRVARGRTWIEIVARGEAPGFG